MGLQKAHSALASLGIHHAWAKLPGKSWESTENPMAIPYPASRYDTYVWEWRMLRSYGERRTATQKLRFCRQQEHLDGLSVLSMLPWWPQRQRNTIIWESDWLAVLYSSSLIPSTFVAETLPTLTSSSRFFFCCWNWPAWMLLWFYTRQSAATLLNRFHHLTF